MISAYCSARGLVKLKIGPNWAIRWTMVQQTGTKNSWQWKEPRCLVKVQISVLLKCCVANWRELFRNMAANINKLKTYFKEKCLKIPLETDRIKLFRVNVAKGHKLMISWFTHSFSVWLHNICRCEVCCLVFRTENNLLLLITNIH